MNAQRLLKLYERVADAPAAVPMLRGFLLDLAARGKLVEQDATDEPASELLERIAAEKVRLVRNGKFKVSEGDLDRDKDNFPFKIPSNWCWCYLDDIAAVARGGSPRPIKSFITDDPKGIPWIKIGDAVRGSIYIDKTQVRIKRDGLAKSRLVMQGDLLLSNSMSFGHPYITNIEGCIHDGWLVIRTPDGLIDKLFLITMFRSDHAKAAFSEVASGAVVQNLNAEKARRLAIPLPPFAEQLRIVARVEELMTLCDRLAKIRTAREDTRDRLTNASYTRLSAFESDDVTFRSHARFAVNLLSELTARADQVKRLRQAVLDLAVRGKLVEQDPADQPVSELLKRIEIERLEAANAKRREYSSHTFDAVDSESHFDLPIGWIWVPLARISDVTMGQSPPGNTYNRSGDGVPLINGPVEFTPGPFGRTIVNQFTTAPTKFCEQDDLLICVRGSTTGRTNIAAFRACIGRGVASIRSSFDDDFVRLFLWKVREDIISMGRGIAFPSVSKKQLEALAIPLPPLAEQRRIVAKVDELMALCDQLTDSLGAVDSGRLRLLESLLGETLKSARNDIVAA